MTDLVEVTRTGSRIEIILNRPEKKNALTGDMYVAMAEGLEMAESDPQVLSVIIAANGRAFCGGNDVVDFMTNPPEGSDSPVVRFLRNISSSTKVLIAAIQGPAVGIGATMLLHCDHVVAADTANLQFAFVKMALVPEAASSLLLPLAVGHLAAAELMFTGDPLSASDALRLGLVSRVVGDGEQLESARTFSARLDDLPPTALRSTKRLLRSSTTTVAERMEEEGGLFREQLKSADFTEAASAFMERRPPKFT